MLLSHWNTYNQEWLSPMFKWKLPSCWRGERLVSASLLSQSSPSPQGWTGVYITSYLLVLHSIYPCQISSPPLTFTVQNSIKGIAVCILSRMRIVFDIVYCLYILLSHAHVCCFLYLMCVVNKWSQTPKEKNWISSTIWLLWQDAICLGESRSVACSWRRGKQKWVHHQGKGFLPWWGA